MFPLNLTVSVQYFLDSQSELIPLKLKRKLSYKRHYMYDYVTPEKILNALRWLKLHNPLYANVEINEQWLLDDDHDSYNGLINNTDSESPISFDITEVVINVNINIESANDINSPHLTYNY